MIDPDTFGWEVPELDEACVLNDPDDAEDQAILDACARLAEAA